MTEPPNPRSSGDDKTTEEPEYATPEEHEAEGAVGPDEFFETDWSGVESDDDLIDALGSGADISTPDLLEQVLADTLSGDRERVRDAELPDSTHPENVLDEKRRRDEQAAAERRAQSGGSNPMPIADDAARLAAIGADDSAAGAANQAAQYVTDAVSALASAEMALSAAASAVQQASDTATAHAAEAGTLLGGEQGQNVSGAGQQIGSELSNVLSQIAVPDLGGAMAALQSVDLTNTVGQIQFMYEAIRGEASRHSG